MKKILLYLLLFSLALSIVACPLFVKRNKNTGGNTPVVNPNSTPPVIIGSIDFRRPANSDINWFFSRYSKRISMSLRESNVAEFYIEITQNDSFESYMAEVSDTSVISLLNSQNGVVQLSEGRNTVSIKANAEGQTILKVYGINHSGETVLLSGFDNINNRISNRELIISVYHKDFIPAVMNEDEGGDDQDENVQTTDEKELVTTPMSLFPKYFSLDDEYSGFLAFRDNRHKWVNGNWQSSRSRSQGSCGSCSYFSAIGLLEIETKRQLIEVREFPFSQYDIDLSEEELLRLRNFDNSGDRVRRNLRRAERNKWIIPLERHNPYDPVGCNWENKSAVNHPSGVKLNENNVFRVAQKNTPDFNNDHVEVRVKRLLYFRHKAVSVSVRWPKNRWEDVLTGNETFDGRHAVNIIGWDDNYIDDRGQEHGKVWIAQNSHGDNRAKFYIKMGDTDAKPRRYIYIGNVTIEGFEAFKNDLTQENRSWERQLSNRIPERSNRMISSSRINTQARMSILLNPASVFSNVTSIAPQLLYSQNNDNSIIELHKVVFRVERKGENYAPYFPWTIGLSAAIPNPFFRHCAIENETDDYIDFVTHTFRFRNITDAQGKLLISDAWIPAKPEDLVVGYTFVPYD